MLSIIRWIQAEICTAVETHSGLLRVHTCKCADQAATLQLLQKLVAYGCPKLLQSYNGSHFTETVQQWAKDSAVYWLCHIPWQLV